MKAMFTFFSTLNVIYFAENFPQLNFSTKQNASFNIKDECCSNEFEISTSALKHFNFEDAL